MANKTPIMRGGTLKLTGAAKSLMAEVGIRLKKASGIPVKITGHNPALGTSFVFEEGGHEYHVPERMARDCFA